MRYHADQDACSPWLRWCRLICQSLNHEVIPLMLQGVLATGLLTIIPLTLTRTCCPSV
jgi:hypothetical protein